MQNVASKITLKAEVVLEETDRLLVLDFDLVNPNDVSICFLKYNTPFDSCDCFEVTRDGKKIEYDGPFFKKNPPRHADYATIPSLEKLNSKYVISNFYDMSKEGKYEISLKKPFLVSLKFETEIFVDCKFRYILEEHKYRPTLGQLARI